LLHRQEALSFLGIPFRRFIDVEDAERVLRAIRMTPDEMPIDIRHDARESKESNGQGSKSSLEESNTQDIAVSSGNPLLIEEKTPEILGVLVVADGARWPVLREKIANATATLLNVPAYKVQVMPREGGI
jgi:stage III sporulation protein AG